MSVDGIFILRVSRDKDLIEISLIRWLKLIEQRSAFNQMEQ